MGRKKFSADFQLMFRLLKLFLFIGFVVTLGILFAFLSLTVGDIFASLLAFMPTGWALLQVNIQWLKPIFLYSETTFCHFSLFNFFSSYIAFSISLSLSKKQENNPCTTPPVQSELMFFFQYKIVMP